MVCQIARTVEYTSEVEKMIVSVAMLFNYHALDFEGVLKTYRSKCGLINFNIYQFRTRENYCIYIQSLPYLLFEGFPFPFPIVLPNWIIFISE